MPEINHIWVIATILTAGEKLGNGSKNCIKIVCNRIDKTQIQSDQLDTYFMCQDLSTLAHEEQ